MSSHGFIKIVLLLGMTYLLEVTTNAQLNKGLGNGPQINDRLPLGRVGGGAGGFVGPKFPAFQRFNGGNSWLSQMTSGTASFDNGTFFSAIAADAGLGGLGFRLGHRLGNNRPVNAAWNDGLQIGLGPLLLNNFYGGLGTFYTDYNTPNGIGDASGWSSMVTLSSSVSLDLPWLSLGGQVSGYYLPFENKWGYGLPSAVLSFGSQFGVFDPGGALSLGIKGSLAGWDWIIYDTFNANYAATNIADNIFADDAGSGNTQQWGYARVRSPYQSAVDQVGRYQFGGGALLDRPADGISRFQSPRFASGSFSLDRVWHTNSLGAIAGRLISPTTRNLYWIRRDDFWATNNFNKFGNFISGGAYLDNAGNDYVRPYAGYSFGTRDEFQTTHHIINTGAYGSLSQTTSYFANIGWVWGTGGANDVSKALYEFILSQTLGSRLSHFIGGGRTVTDPDYGERYVADYVNYGINFAISPYTVLQATAGVSQTDGSLTQSGEATRSYQGFRIRTSLGLSTFSLSAIHETYDFTGSSGYEVDQWIYRALFAMPVGGQRTTAYTGYQFIDRGTTSRTSSSFQEHLFLLYMSHRF